MSQQRVVVTGSSGRLGRIAVAALAGEGHDVVGIDCNVPPVEQPQFIRCDLGDVSGLRSAVERADCIIHLAALPDDADSFDFRSDLVPVNVTGTYNVLDAARQAGVRRVMLASSLQVVDGYMREGQYQIGVAVPLRPRYLYATTKVILEALGQVFAGRHGLDVLVIRFGWCPRDRKQIAEIDTNPLYPDMYLSPADAGRFFCVAVNAGNWGTGRFNIVNLTSNPKGGRERLDLAPARKIGYSPLDQWPAGATEGLIA